MQKFKLLFFKLLHIITFLIYDDFKLHVLSSDKIPENL